MINENSMTQRAREISQGLDLKAAGIPIASPAVRQVRTWEEACEVFSHEDWNDVIVDLSNLMTASLDEHEQKFFTERYDKWSQRVAHEVGPAVQMYLSRIPDFFNPFRERAERFITCLIIFAAVEEEMASRCENPVSSRIIRWAIEGHFVCGFDELDERMRTVVY